MNVAVYGGSFDPPHLGHVMVITHLLLNDPTIDEVMVVPCFQQAGKNLTDFRLRKDMCGEAFCWMNRVGVDSVEQYLGGESITLRTMQYLKSKWPEWNLRFVMGSDLLESCKTWDGWDELEKIAPPLPIGRAGVFLEREGAPTPISPIVSSSIVRKLLAEGDYDAAQRYVPRGVLDIIKRYSLYRDAKI